MLLSSSQFLKSLPFQKYYSTLERKKKTKEKKTIHKLTDMSSLLNIQVENKKFVSKSIDKERRFSDEELFNLREKKSSVFTNKLSVFNLKECKTDNINYVNLRVSSYAPRYKPMVILLSMIVEQIKNINVTH